MYLPGTVQERIRDLYTKNDITQKELADLIGIAPSQLSRIGTGKTQHISSDILIKLAKALKVSTDYILGLTTVSTPKSYDISELGLSEGTVKNLLTLKDNMPVLNRLLAHRSFPSLINQIKIYFYDELAMGVTGRNELFDMAVTMLDGHRKEHPEDSATVREKIRFVNAEKFGKHEIDIEKIKNTFLAILKDIKKDIDTGKEPEASATADFMQQLREQLTESQLQAKPLPTADDLSEVILQMVRQQHPALDEKSAELFQQLMKQLFTKPEE